MSMNLKHIIPILTDNQSFVLTTHLNPDGDGLGSQLALGEYLVSRGKSVRLINESPVPRHYTFLDKASNRIEIYQPELHESIVKESDCIIILDTNHPARLGSMEEAVVKSRAVKLVIDHHLERDEFADHYLIDENATATGEIVYYLLKELTGGTFTDSIAVNLYTAIMTDTGSFRFPKTNSSTHTITADLLRYTVDPSDIYREVYERGPANRIVLLGKALATLETHHSGRLALMYVTKDIFEDTDTDLVETDGFVNYALQIDGVVIGVFLTENGNTVKLSFRGRGDVWVNKFAQEFGGNGHQHAAGATVKDGRLTVLAQEVIQKAPMFLP
jgi:bifunctional oligoribonuclease and PAP phosphatase NrnA